jgi:hypothetical protein
VARLKVCANLQILRPSERQWKPRLRQALARYVPYGDSAHQTGTKIMEQKNKNRISHRKKCNFAFYQNNLYK